MPETQSGERSGALEALAQSHFPYREFTTAERTLLAKAAMGKVAVCGPNSNPEHGTNPSTAGGWGREPEISADLIRWLCVDHQAKEQVDPIGVNIQGAKITGELYLNFAVVPFPIRLSHCALTKDACLQHVEIPWIDLEGTRTKSIDADGIVVQGGVFLRNKFHADGEVRCLGAQIGGDLDCVRAAFNNPNGPALSPDRAVVKGGVFLRYGFQADGEVRCSGAQIGNDLDCRCGVFNGSKGYAVDAEHIEVKGNVFLSDGFAAMCRVNLLGAQVGGDLSCEHGKFNNANGDALNLERAGGSVHLRHGFSAR